MKKKIKTWLIKLILGKDQIRGRIQILGIRK